MCSPTKDIGVYCSDKDILMSLESYIRGTPFPSNVISDIDPYQHLPSVLPDGIWYFLRSNSKKDADFGYWRTKGEACQIYSNSFSSGWRSTLEFFEGRDPQGTRTNWVMQEFWITRSILSKENNANGFSSLCNVFFDGDRNSSHLKPLEIAQVGRSSQSVAEKGINDSETTSKLQIGDDNKAKSGVTIRERDPETGSEAVPEVNYFSEDDFLELLDLEIPPSPSSSSDSSCVTISSDECFDTLELLQDIDSEKSHDQVHNNAGLKLSIHASSTPSEIISYPPSTGTLNKLVSEEMKERNVRISDENLVDDPNRAQKSSSRSKAVMKCDQKDDRGRMKKLKIKYFCFMPF